MAARRIARGALAAIGLLLATAQGSAAATTTTTGSVTSFDGTPIAYTLYVPDDASKAHPVPAVLVGHAWGQSRNFTTGVRQPLIDAGYAVLTWDSRGFGDSGGQVNFAAQEYEVRDVQTLIGFLAGRPGVLLDGPGDPRVGMAGGSYGGGIQLMAGSADRRIDAITPAFAWNDVSASLRPNGVLKFGATQVLYALGLAGSRARLAPEVNRWAAETTALNDWSPETQAWIDSRGPRRYIRGATLGDGRRLPGIRAPALLIEGTPDSLFPLNEAIANRNAIRANGVDTKLVFTCDGHTYNPDPVCKPDPIGLVGKAVLRWFDKYLRGRRATDTGRAIDYQTQDGGWHSTDALPTTYVTATGSGRLTSVGAPTSGIFAAPSPSPDGFRFGVPVKAGLTILGLPRATVSVTGEGSVADLFFKLLDVDTASGRTVVMDDQVMAQRVSGLSSSAQSFRLDLGGLAWRVESGHQVMLEVSSSSNTHGATRTPSSSAVQVKVEVPVVRDEGGASDRCLNSRGGARGKRLGPAVLGRTRARQRRAFRGKHLHSRGGIDRYCATGGGSFRIGYPTRRLRRRLGRGVRARVRGRAILLLTSSRRFSVRGVRPGSSTRGLKGRRYRIGRNVWCLARGRRTRLVFKTRGGKALEVGIADKRLTRGRRAARSLLHAWHL